MGEVYDPTENEIEIGEATRVLNEFIIDMEENRVPKVTLDELSSASENLGLYAGYPEETAHIISFLDISGGESYRKTASILKEYLNEMNSLIEARKSKSIELTTESGAKSQPKSQIDCDIPF